MTYCKSKMSPKNNEHSSIRNTDWFVSLTFKLGYGYKFIHVNFQHFIITVSITEKREQLRGQYI